MKKRNGNLALLRRFKYFSTCWCRQKVVIFAHSYFYQAKVLLEYIKSYLLFIDPAWWSYVKLSSCSFSWDVLSMTILWFKFSYFQTRRIFGLCSQRLKTQFSSSIWRSTTWCRVPRPHPATPPVFSINTQWHRGHLHHLPRQLSD